MSGETEHQTTEVRFNINDYARVKLTPATLKLWKQNAQAMRKAFPKMAHLWTDEPRTDKDGYYRDQLWVIINLIAPECVAGGQALENSELILEMPR